MSTASVSLDRGCFTRPVRWAVLSCALLHAGACASVELQPGGIDETSGRHFRFIHVQVALANENDTVRLNNRLITELDSYDLQASLSGEIIEQTGQQRPQAARLRIYEVERRIETVYYRRTYGRTSLTQMRGRKSREVPVITLRVVLTDIKSDEAVFQADYVTQGPWYADGAARVASLARSLTVQLAEDGFIAAMSTDSVQ